MIKRRPLTLFLITYCVVSLVVGLVWLVAAPTTAVADGGGLWPPERDSTGDSTGQGACEPAPDADTDLTLIDQLALVLLTTP